MTQHDSATDRQPPTSTPVRVVPPREVRASEDHWRRAATRPVNWGWTAAEEAAAFRPVTRGDVARAMRFSAGDVA